MGTDNPTIAIGSADGGLYVALRGTATQRICPTVDRVVSDYLDSQPPHPALVLDLSGCAWIDSTFAGWLIGLRRRAAKLGASIKLANCNERCAASLAQMHLTSLFACAAAGAPPDVRELACCTGHRPDRAALQLMLDAQQNLAAVNESNAKLFGPIVEVLRKQIESG